MNGHKAVNDGYNVSGKPVDRVEIKLKLTDKGGTFYVYDLFDVNNNCVALNRYVFINNNAERPFAKLTKPEEDTLNPPVEVVEKELI